MQSAVDAHLQESIGELREILSIPNISSEPEHVERSAVWLEKAFRARQFDVARLETDGPPLLLAERTVHAGGHTVLFYMHADGQPVDPDEWAQPDPFEPVLKAPSSDGTWRPLDWSRIDEGVDPDWRVFARSAADDTSPIVMLLQAVERLDEIGRSPAFNVKVILDFEEEIGSPHLPAAVNSYQEHLEADRMLILDGPRHPSNLPTLTFGARGIQTLTLTVHGPRAPQHSGHYGNYVPNPARRLSQLLASMIDEDGRVTIPGYYDAVELDEETMEILRAVPDDEEAIQRSLGIAGPDSVGASLQAALQYPSFNVRGMRAGWVGEEVRTIVPDRAVAEIDMRLVPENDPDRLLRLVKGHIQDQGYHILNGEPTDEERQAHERLLTMEHQLAYQAFRTNIDSPTGVWLTRAMKRAFDQDIVRKRTSGGSIPIAPFIQALDIPAVTVPTVNHDNNQHSPDENLRLGNFADGIKTVMAILTEPIGGRSQNNGEE